MIRKVYNKKNLLLGLALISVFIAQQAFAQTTALHQIQFTSLPGNRIQLELAMDGEPRQIQTFNTENPARIAIDLMGVANKSGKRAIDIGLGKALSVRAVEAKGKTRVVINLTSSVPYTTKVEGNSVFLTLNGTSASALPKSVIDPVDKTKLIDERKGRRISHIDFRRGLAGEGRVLVNLSDASALVDVKEEGGKVIVDIMDTALPPELANHLDVIDFATPVTAIDIKPAGKNTRLIISAVGAYEFLSYQMGELLTVEFKRISKEQLDREVAEKFKYTGEKLTLDFQDIPVRTVLQILADVTDMNLVASDSVGGNVTLRLNNVPRDQALEVILTSKGLGKRVEGNVMMVGPASEIARQEKEALKAKQQVQELAPLVSEFIEISYASASEIAALLKAAKGQLISSRGGVTIDARTNTLLVQDTAEKIVEIKKIIQRIDRPVRQVMIESRIVIANDDFTRDLGIRFGLQGIDINGTSVIAAGGAIPSASGGAPPFGVGLPDALLVDLPVASPAGAVQFIIGKIGNSLLQLELSALQTEAKGEVISSPRVITSDQVQAEIRQGIEIPFQEATSSGATSTRFISAEINLTVTPRITPDDRINLELDVSKDAPDFSNIQPDGVPINTQNVTTTVLVDNGDTVILGGIYERTENLGVRKVPFFGDLPVVGNLFKAEFKQDNNRELLFFITPKILKEGLSVN